MSTEIPKHELLLKLLRMTESSSDGEALTAIRKANQLLASAGWDWEKVLTAKITVVGDPFGSISKPPTTNRTEYDRPTTPSRPTPPPPPPPPTKPARPFIDDDDFGFTPPRARPGNAGASTSRWASGQRSPPPPPPKPTPLSDKKNMYSNHCYCCGVHTPSQLGWIINPCLFNKNFMNKWMVVCDACNTAGVVPGAASPKQKPPSPSILDL